MKQNILSSYHSGIVNNSIYDPSSVRFHDWTDLKSAQSYFAAAVANLETLGHDRIPSASVNHVTPKGNLIRSETYEIYDTVINKQVTRTVTLTASESEV